MREGTFPRSRRENILNLDHNARVDSVCDEGKTKIITDHPIRVYYYNNLKLIMPEITFIDYTGSIDDVDREIHQTIPSCYPIYASFPRVTRSSGHLHIEHHGNCYVLCSLLSFFGI